MGPPLFACAAQIDIEPLEQCCIIQVRTLLPPFVKLGRTVMRREEVTQVREPFGVTERQGAQQQRIDYAEDTCTGADSDRQGKNREGCVPRPAAPESHRVSGVLCYFAGKLVGHP